MKNSFSHIYETDNEMTWDGRWDGKLWDRYDIVSCETD